MKKETRYTIEATQDAYYGKAEVSATFDGARFHFKVDADEEVEFYVARSELVDLIKATEPQQVFSSLALAGHLAFPTLEQSAEWLRAHRGEIANIDILRKSGQVECRSFEVYSINEKDQTVYAFQRDHAHYERFKLDAIRGLTASGITFDPRADITL